MQINKLEKFFIIYFSFFISFFSFVFSIDNDFDDNGSDIDLGIEFKYFKLCSDVVICIDEVKAENLFKEYILKFKDDKIDFSFYAENRLDGCHSKYYKCGLTGGSISDSDIVKKTNYFGHLFLDLSKNKLSDISGLLVKLNFMQKKKGIGNKSK